MDNIIDIVVVSKFIIGMKLKIKYVMYILNIFYFVFFFKKFGNLFFVKLFYVLLFKNGINVSILFVVLLFFVIE